ncbi:hypothetical protein LXL04_037083 [Taraxacum kok-saghyz]
MIPIAIRGILPDNIRHTITKLCLFFNMIHSKVIDPEVLDSWQRDIIITLCQLEIYFPPSFFDVMVHLVSHIVREIKICGPVFQRYMYGFERYMGFLKGYVRNRSRPEGSIVKGYASEDVIEYCTNYLKGANSIGLPQSHHEGRLLGVGTLGLKTVIPDRDEFHLAYFTVLQHMTAVAPYMNEHMTMLRSMNGTKTEKWLVKEQIRTFPEWLKDKVKASLGTKDVNPIVQLLGKSTVQNSGVTVLATSVAYSCVNHESRSVLAKDSYYGVIQEIWELKYDSSTVIPMFKCKWVNNKRGVRVDDDGFTIVNFSTHGYVSKPFILSTQANQVFFVEDTKDTRWHIALHGKRRILSVENVVDEEEYNQFDELPPFSIGIPVAKIACGINRFPNPNIINRLPVAAVPLPSHSPSIDDQSMEAYDPELNNSISNFEVENCDFQYRSVTDFDGKTGIRDSIPSNSANTDLGLRFAFDDLFTEVASPGNPIPKLELVDNSAFESTVYTDSINRLSNLTRKFENANSKSPVAVCIITRKHSDIISQEEERIEGSQVTDLISQEEERREGVTGYLLKGHE